MKSTSVLSKNLSLRDASGSLTRSVFFPADLTAQQPAEAVMKTSDWLQPHILKNQCNTFSCLSQNLVTNEADSIICINNN